MATLAELVSRFATQERPVGNMLDEAGLLAQGIAAVSFYAGYADLAAHLAISLTLPPTPYPAIDGDTAVSLSEWALIRPLFLLYVEREQALYLEASRGMGIDPYGRSSSEVAADITQTEKELPHQAFSQPILSIY